MDLNDIFPGFSDSPGAPNSYIPDYLEPMPPALRSFFSDEEGYQIFDRWFTGKGDWPDAPFGDYLMKSRDLQVRVGEEIKIYLDDLFNSAKCCKDYKGVISVELSDNGYKTGYELLHGTNKKAGDFQIEGKICKRDEGFYGKFSYTWNDIIDPNGSYFLDNILSVGAKIFSLGRAKDYTT